ncbi:hypothetical protein [Streptomyces sp. AC602_WCS936]|uniref:hypothetical protein n=1 Tax=Streptomyces sp. AC602_WCS936 TaxID=2823685 RepID=UPI001C26EC06|nr:hypothetical protein [Streptomyces sp. AC602_WCS936]
MNQGISTHRVPLRQFSVPLSATRRGARLARLPVSPRTTVAAHAESGYGLLLVEELADRWGVRCEPVPSKTVWAELDLGAEPSVSGHETSHRIDQ